MSNHNHINFLRSLEILENIEKTQNVQENRLHLKLEDKLTVLDQKLDYLLQSLLSFTSANLQFNVIPDPVTLVEKNKELQLKCQESLALILFEIVLCYQTF